MKTNKMISYTGLLAILALAFFPRAAAAQGTKILHGHVPAAVSRLHLQSTGQLPPDASLNLTISLPLQNEQALDDLLQQIYDPSSTNYHHYLTPNQFYGQFGPSAQDYEKALNFAKVSGFSIISTYSNQMILDVSGKASDIEKAFQIKFQTYHHPTEHRDFYAPDREPTVDASLPNMYISGLDNFVIPHPLLKIKPLGQNVPGSKPELGSGPGGTYIGNDFRAAYAPGVALNGTGQSVALFELDGYFTADILSYEGQAGLPNVPIANIAVDGGVPNPTSYGDPEVSLDIETVISMAPNMSQLLVYEAPNGVGNSVADLLNRIASDDLASQISSSWGIGDSPIYDVFYKQMALQGQTFLQASGDDGAFYPGIGEWSDDTNITLVGGTTLSTTAPGGAWSSEKVWNWLSSGEGNAGSGGGTNINGIPIPSWQQGVNMSINQGSTTLRNVPDVALTADNIYVTYGNGVSGSFGGTSCAAPLWAGFIALVNQQAVANSQPNVGFINPAIYAIGQSANYTSCFHDITTGNNTNLVVANQYFAVRGYDLCTGWGTPNGGNLINALLALPAGTPFTHLSAPQPPYGTTLGVLNGGNPNGNWYLFVQDDQVLNGGMISNGWAITLTTANPIGYVADNSVTMSASTTNMMTGSDVTFNIGVTNFGPSTSTNVVVLESFPSGFTLVSSSETQGAVYPNGVGTLSWDVGNLAYTNGAQMNLTLQAPNTAESDVINSATVSAQTLDQNSADDNAYVILNVFSVAKPQMAGTEGVNGKFLLSISGADFPVIVQASTNLVNWVNISTNTPPFIFTDSVTPGFPYRFYRALVQ